jgi:hypothetical protein
MVKIQPMSDPHRLSPRVESGARESPPSSLPSAATQELLTATHPYSTSQAAIDAAGKKDSAPSNAVKRYTFYDDSMEGWQAAERLLTELRPDAESEPPAEAPTIPVC